MFNLLNVKINLLTIKKLTLDFFNKKKNKETAFIKVGNLYDSTISNNQISGFDRLIEAKNIDKIDINNNVIKNNFSKGEKNGK